MSPRKKKRESHEKNRTTWNPNDRFTGPNRRGIYHYRNRHGQWIGLDAINEYGLAKILTKLQDAGHKDSKWWVVVNDELHCRSAETETMEEEDRWETG